MSDDIEKVLDAKIAGHWTLDDERWQAHLRAHVIKEKTLDDQDRAQQTAANKSEAALEKRLESMNEFRQQLNTQASTFITRNEYEAKHETVVESLNVIRRPNWQLLVSTALLILGLYGFAIKPLQDKIDRDSELLQNISLYGSPILQERLNRLEAYVFGKPQGGGITGK